MIITKARAWVIRWEDITNESNTRKVIAIMDSRIPGERMKWFVEQFYMTQTSTFAEMVHYAKRSQNNPDKARFMTNEDKVQCTGFITCGHERLLIATIVKDVKVQRFDDGTQQVSWTDIPMPPREISGPPR